MRVVPVRDRRRLLAAGAVAALIVAALGITAAPVAADPACAVLRQLTDDPEKGTNYYDLSADGKHVVFNGDGDFAGDNADKSKEVFRIDLASGTTAQITDTTGGDTEGVSISADGSLIAFSSDRDLVTENPDESFEIFLYTVAIDDTVQISDSTADSFSPSMSADGTRIAYSSLADGNSEIVVFDTTLQQSIPVTQSTTGNSWEPRISADGRFVAFESTADLVGENSDGTSEIFRHDLVEDETIQITHDTVEQSLFARISPDGDTVTFSSRSDLLGTNDDGNLELFVYDVTDDDLRQLTVTTSGTSSGGDVSAGGDRIAFGTTGELLGGPPSSESILYDADDDVFVPITNTPGAITSGVAMSADTTQFVVRTRANLLGGNPDGSFELYYAACGSATPTFTDVGPAHTFFDEIEWMAAGDVSTGYSDGTYRPALPVSRGAMAAFMHRLVGSPDVDLTGPPTFSDVGPGHLFYESIEWMAATGVSTGFGDGTYRPDAVVHRDAMSGFLHRLAGSPDVDLTGPPTFSDVGPGHLFYEAIEWMSAAEVSTGYPDGTYRPADDVSRGAMSAFLHRLAAGPGVGI